MDRTEYVFGRDSLTGTETLLTKGPEHTDLQGFQDVVREYDDTTITDSFLVTEHVGSETDGEGNCYDWYTIDKHFRTIDKTKKIAEQTTQNSADLEYIAMMAGIDLPSGETDEEV